jgi:hypothetical protein
MCNGIQVLKNLCYQLSKNSFVLLIFIPEVNYTSSEMRRLIIGISFKLTTFKGSVKASLLENNT